MLDIGLDAVGGERFLLQIGLLRTSVPAAKAQYATAIRKFQSSNAIEISFTRLSKCCHVRRLLYVFEGKGVAMDEVVVSYVLQVFFGVGAIVFAALAVITGLAERETL